MTRKTTQQKPLGRYESCRVVAVGVEKMGECMKQGPATCSYAVPFGYCFLCKNPRVDEMIENTKKAQAQSGIFN